MSNNRPTAPPGLTSFHRQATLSRAKDRMAREVSIPTPIRFLESLFSRPDTSIEDRSRRGYFALCLMIVIPALAGYSFIDLGRGRLEEASTTLVLTAVMVGVLFLMPRLRQVWGIFRVTYLLAAGLALYTTANGGSDGLAFIYFYTTPLIVFFLFGGREGVLWVGTIFVALLLLFFGGISSYAPDPGLSFRFMITFGIVSVLGFGLETSRHRSYQKLLAEKTSLEDALTHAKTLSGLLPICASCKSVRDDRGYWSQIETYVRQRSEVDFSPGLCPECCARPTTPVPPREVHAPSHR